MLLSMAFCKHLEDVTERLNRKIRQRRPAGPSVCDPGLWACREQLQTGGSGGQGGGRRGGKRRPRRSQKARRGPRGSEGRGRGEGWRRRPAGQPEPGGGSAECAEVWSLRAVRAEAWSLTLRACGGVGPARHECGA